MSDLKNTSSLVKAILEEDQMARNSDTYLYLKVLEHHAAKNNLNLRLMSVPVFLNSMDKHGFPGFETVRRARQKVQVAFPALAGSEAARKARAQKREEYRAYARGGIDG